MLGDLNIATTSATADADVDHLVHLPRHPRRARRDRADRQHHRRQHRPAGRRLHAQRAAQRRHRRRRCGREELRLCRRQRTACRGSAGGFFSHTDRDYGQNLLGGRLRGPRPAFRPRACARPRTCCSSRISATSSISSRSSAKATLPVTDRARRHRRPALLRLQRGQRADLRRHLRQRQHRDVAGLAAGLDERQRLRAALHRELQGCRDHATSTRRSRTASVSAASTTRSTSRSARRRTSSRSAAGNLEGRDGLELRGGRQVEDPGRPRRVQRRPRSTWTSATCRRR